MTTNGEPSAARPVTSQAAADGTGALVGKRIGNYVVERLLASGGMGEVYVARHAALLDKVRVVKTILPVYAARQDIRERFEREALAVARLGDHAHIVGIEDYGSLDDGRLWMMMPFVEGQSLDHHVSAQGGTLPPYRILEMLCDIGLALDHSHQLGIIHRDIKPSNIFVSPTRGGGLTYKLLDFGIARQRQSSPSTTQIALGTPWYMAPEQYTSAGTADVPADIYALTCVVWELETGKPPYADEDSAVLYSRKVNEAPPPPHGGTMPGPREQLLRANLAPDPRARAQSVRAFIADYAATIPAISPYVPSGPALLKQRAELLTYRSATETTVRRKTTATPSPLVSAPRTTLGSANGTVSTNGAVPTVPRAARSKLIGISTAVALVAGLGVYVVAVSQHGGASPSPESVRPANAAPIRGSDNPGTPTNIVTPAVPAPTPSTTPPAPPASAAATAPSTTPTPPAPPASTAATAPSSKPAPEQATPASASPPDVVPSAIHPAAPAQPPAVNATSARSTTTEPQKRKPNPPAAHAGSRSQDQAPPPKTKRKFDRDALGGEENE